MCIIAVCKTRALEIDEFSDCWRSNSDGVGMAYPDGKGVWIHKGLMKMSAALEAYRDLTLPHVIHFRSASSGSICRELTHPFIIDKNSEPVYAQKFSESPVLFHNGTFTDWKPVWMGMIMSGKVIRGRMSDSRLIAIVCGQSISNDDSNKSSDNNENVHVVTHILESTGGKHAIICPNGQIIMIGTFTEKRDKGIWLSSEPWEQRFIQSSYTGRKWDYEKKTWMDDSRDRDCGSMLYEM